MSEDETYQWIEDYLNGALGKEEVLAFEEQLSTDAGLSKKIRLHQMANELVIENRLQQVNSILLEEKRKGNSGNNLTRIILGAAILAIGTLVFFLWKNKNNTTEAASSPQKLITAETNTTFPVSEQTTLSSNKNTIYKKQPAETIQNKTENVVTEQPLPIISGSAVTDVATEKDHVVKDLPVPTPVQEKLIAGPCATVQLSAKVTTNASCKEESNGSISVREYAGGTAPYTVNIKNKQQEYVSALNVPAGIYTVFIQDKKGCTETFYNIQVPEKLCNKEYTFNPFMEELLELPAQDQHGTLAVYERSGNLYFTKDIEPSELIKWNGYSKNGELNPGYFIFVLTLKDGQTSKGGITIVR